MLSLQTQTVEKRSGNEGIYVFFFVVIIFKNKLAELVLLYWSLSKVPSISQNDDLQIQRLNMELV